MKKTALLIACAGLIIGGISLAAPETASAGIRVSFGSGSYGGYGYSNSRYTSYNRGFIGGNRGGFIGVNRNYGGYGGGIYGGSAYGAGSYGGFGNRRSYGGHYDYHPTTLVPHGNHLHVIPGHYDYHQGGHGHGHHH